jgi:hypothetical protein
MISPHENQGDLHPLYSKVCQHSNTKVLVVEPDYLPDSEGGLYPMKYPHKYVHSSTWGSAEGGLSPRLGGLGASGGSGAKPPKKKLPCKSIL